MCLWGKGRGGGGGGGGRCVTSPDNGVEGDYCYYTLEEFFSQMVARTLITCFELRGHFSFEKLHCPDFSKVLPVYGKCFTHGGGIISILIKTFFLVVH